MESLLNQLVFEINKLNPEIDQLQLRSNIASTLSLYKFQKINTTQHYPDLLYYIDLFLSTKQLEGLSKITLYNYKLNLNIFNKMMNKYLNDITTSDIRGFLSGFSHLKQTSIATKVSVLKSFFNWLEIEESPRTLVTLVMS